MEKTTEWDESGPIRARWDTHWRDTIANESRRSDESHPTFQTLALSFIEFLCKRRSRKILFAGNGISLEPYIFLEFGFSVTVLDVSAVACDYVRSAATMGHDLAVSFVSAYDMHWEQSDSSGEFATGYTRGLLETGWQQEGQMEIVESDILRYHPPEPYDVVYANRLLQGYSPSGMDELINRFLRWLNPGGIALVETWNMRGNSQSVLQKAFEDRGFFVHLQRTDRLSTEGLKRLMQTQPPRDEAADRFENEMHEAEQKETAEEIERLNRGEKMVAFLAGSG